MTLIVGATIALALAIAGAAVAVVLTRNDNGRRDVATVPSETTVIPTAPSDGITTTVTVPAPAPRPVARPHACSGFRARAGDGTTFAVNGISALRTLCTEAKAMIDGGPAFRSGHRWVCPVTGNRFHTSCRRGSQRVTWDIPRGESQVAPPPAPPPPPPPPPVSSGACPSFSAVNTGTPFVASGLQLSNTSCAEATAMIKSGPRGRVAAGWVCPKTGDRTFTSCTRGNQRVAWDITE